MEALWMDMEAMDMEALWVVMVVRQAVRCTAVG
jgi:hypothetical protein